MYLILSIYIIYNLKYVEIEYYDQIWEKIYFTNCLINKNMSKYIVALTIYIFIRYYIMLCSTSRKCIVIHDGASIAKSKELSVFHYRTYTVSIICTVVQNIAFYMQ